MASMRDRMERGGPIWRDMADRLDSIIRGHNELVSVVLNGQNPHKVNDVTNVLTVLTAGLNVDDITNLAQNLITKYEAHIGSTTHHLGADSTNVVTEVGVPIEIYALLDELKVDYEAHRVYLGGSAHAGTDAVNVVTEANATTKATAVDLANELSALMQLNFVNVTSHHGGSGDTVGAAALLALGVLDGDSTWVEIATVADGIRSAYEAHRVLTAGSVHGGADGTNTVTATAIGTFTTALYAGINELKGDFNAHILESGTSHKLTDSSMTVSEAAATTTATAQALVNALKVAYTDHISRAEEIIAGALVPLLSEE